ncbi:MAG: methylated-DNA--[protein]-cysteine S-methyltransferase [Thermodesulfovibrio sp.]|nr:methylated-DNA--[protein]-cysteine S-methyltransferase [Thermodesulfovibrio sp.]
MIEITKTDELKTEEEGEFPETIKKLKTLLDDYFSGKAFIIDYPVKMDNVSRFDKKVLDFVRQIPFGHTVSYRWTAENLQTSPRAVGQALKRNPLPIIIPCHRIIKSNGELGGYSMGIEAKKWLIEHEKTTLYKLLSHKT